MVAAMLEHMTRKASFVWLLNDMDSLVSADSLRSSKHSLHHEAQRMHGANCKGRLPTALPPCTVQTCGASGEHPGGCCSALDLLQ